MSAKSTLFVFFLAVYCFFAFISTSSLKGSPSSVISASSFPRAPNLSCPVCLDEVVLDETAFLAGCGHFSHEICSVGWIKTCKGKETAAGQKTHEKITCPLCMSSYTEFKLDELNTYFRGKTKAEWNAKDSLHLMDVLTLIFNIGYQCTFGPIVESLSKKTFDWNDDVLFMKGMVLIYVALKTNKPRVFEILLKHDCEDHKRFLRDSLQRGASLINIMNVNHFFPAPEPDSIISALSRKVPLALEALLPYEVNVNAIDANSLTTPIQYAVINGLIDSFEVLLAFKHTNLSITDERGKTLLHYAAESDNSEFIKNIFEIITKVQIDLTEDQQAELDAKKKQIRSTIDLPDAEGKSPLLLALENNNFDAIELLLDHNAKVDIRVIAECLENHHRETLRYILVTAALKNLLDKRALMEAVSLTAHDESLQFFQMLLGFEGVELDKVDDRGKTLLHRTIETGSVETAKFLLNLDSEIYKAQIAKIVKLPNGNGKTPLALATTLKQTEIIDILKKMTKK